MASPSGRAQFPGTGAIHAGALVAGVEPAQNGIFSVWRRTARLHRERVCHDGSHTGPCHHRAEVWDDSAGELSSDAVSFDYPSAQNGHHAGTGGAKRSATGAGWSVRFVIKPVSEAAGEAGCPSCIS